MDVELAKNGTFSTFGEQAAAALAKIGTEGETDSSSNPVGEGDTESTADIEDGDHEA
ncbi:hypothetical protein [Streptomyces sp. NPDC086776]|uniref:hypothetical protein n=1 Tax=Streptomyces sp. NPDC086776 TaxID=3365756 RepID=UPI0037FD95B9